MAFFSTIFAAIKPYSEALAGVLTRLQNRALSSGALAIKTASSPLAKTASAVAYGIAGKLYSLAAGDITLPAASTIAAGYARVFFLFVNAAGTISYVASASVAAGDIASVSIMPDYDCTTLVPFGAIKVANGTASVFTPATTPLDTASLTVTYVNLSAPMPGQAV